MKNIYSILIIPFIWIGSLHSQINLITDGNWRGVGNSGMSGGTAWLFQGYDDSSWPFVEAPNVANIIPVVPGSLSIWVLPYSDTAKMRSTFVVPVADSYTGSISINADNEFELYFNGISQGFYNNWMAGPYVFDISPGLQGCVQNVVAINAANWGGPYGASLNTTLAVNNPLNTPVAGLPTNVTCSGFTANWDSVPTADYYMLDVSTDPTFASFYSVYHDYNMASSLNEILASLPPGIPYYYRLRCHRGILTSCYSNVVQVDLNDPSVSYTAPDSICAGETIDLQLSAPSGGTYGWTGPNGFSDPDSVGIITNTSALNSGNYVYTVNYPGCPTISDTISITVVDNPPLIITPAGPYCSTGTSDTLVANGSGLQWSGVGITNTTLGIFNPINAGVGTHLITSIVNNYCPDTATISVIVTLNGGYGISGSDTVCEGSPIELLSTSGPTATVSWTGPNGFTSASNNNTIAPSNNTHSGFYILSISYPNCPALMDTLPISIVSYQNPSITPAGPFCNDDPEASLIGTPGGGIWLGIGITNANDGTFDPNIAGNGSHNILYLFPGSCPDTASIEINVANSVHLSSVIFPNVFTPNSDGQNDLFFPQVPSGGHYALVIFDRWGIQVFEADQDISWNGQIGGSNANEGIYYWICEITSDCSSEPLVEKGFLQLFKP